MKNFSQLSLFFLAALTVGQAVAEDMSFSLVNRAFVAMGNPGLGRRQGISEYYCPAGSYQCPGNFGCCEIGSQCIPGEAKCKGSCGAGATDCYGSCCKAGYACVGKDQPCLKVDTVPLPITEPVPTTSKVIIPGTTLLSSSTATIPIYKDTTSSTTLVKPYPTIPVGSTYTMTKPGPTYPPMTTGGYSSNNTSYPKNATTSLAIIPVGGSNTIKPAGWLGGFGIAFFLAFLHM